MHSASKEANFKAILQMNGNFENYLRKENWHLIGAAFLFYLPLVRNLVALDTVSCLCRRQQQDITAIFY